MQEAQSEVVKSSEPSSLEGGATSQEALFRQAIDEIKVSCHDRQPYSLETAETDKPLIHYSRAGNIFQILRFGIQSNNFKNRVNELREEDGALDEAAPQMGGFRIKQGGSYQGADSISLSAYSDKIHIPPKNVIYFIDPELSVYGSELSERDRSLGYGYGIPIQVHDGGYEIGNPTAYPDEVLAANVIPPSRIKGVLVDKSTSILNDVSQVARGNALIFTQVKYQDLAAATEDLLANCRLLAELSGSSAVEQGIAKLVGRVTELPLSELSKEIVAMQRQALNDLVGDNEELTEATLRAAIVVKFNISIIEKP